MNHNPITIAVVIPAWNASEYIAQAITSALQQTYSPVEIIVVDDGSEDSTHEIAAAFEPQVRILKQQHSGACAARNLGYRSSNCEYVQFLDADDWMYKNKLEAHINAIERTSPDCLTFCDVDVVSPQNGRIIGTKAVDWDDGDPIRYLLKPPLVTNAVLYPRAALDKTGGFNEALDCCQDLDINLRIAAHGFRFARINECLCANRELPDSISRKDPLRVIENHMVVINSLLDLLQKLNGLNENRLLWMSELLARDARQLVSIGQQKLARQFWSRAGELHESSGLGAMSKGFRSITAFCGPYYASRLAQWRHHRIIAN